MPSFDALAFALTLPLLATTGCDSGDDASDSGAETGSADTGSASATGSADDAGSGGGSADDASAGDSSGDSAGGGDVDTPEPGVVQFAGDIDGVPFSGRCDATTGSLVSSGLASRLTVSCTEADAGQLVFVILTSSPVSPFSFGLADAPPTSPTHGFTLDGAPMPPMSGQSVSSVFDHLEAVTVEGTYDGAGHLVWTFDATWANAPDQPGYHDGTLHGSGDIVITEL